jgi:hypothetical protein
MVPMRGKPKMMKIMPVIGMTFMLSRIITSVVEVVYLVKIAKKLDALKAIVDSKSE